MPTPPKPVSVLKAENKSHRTKQELRNREVAEQSLLSGKKLKESKEVRNDPTAHNEFLRLVKLLKAIEKNDELYASSINRYCMMTSECVEFLRLREKMESLIDDLHDHQDDFEYPEFIRMQDNLQRNLINLDKQIQAKRKMMFDIEKENVMTIASSLRSIPKKTQPRTNVLANALLDD